MKNLTSVPAVMLLAFTINLNAQDVPVIDWEEGSKTAPSAAIVLFDGNDLSQ